MQATQLAICHNNELADLKKQRLLTPDGARMIRGAENECACVENEWLRLSRQSKAENERMSIKNEQWRKEFNWQQWKSMLKWCEQKS